MSAVRRAIQKWSRDLPEEYDALRKNPAAHRFRIPRFGINKLHRIKIIAEWILPQFGIIKNVLILISGSTVICPAIKRIALIGA